MYEVDELDRIVELASVPQFSIGAPCPILMSDEHTTVVAYHVQEKRSDSVAMVQLSQCYATMFGPPNDEAFEGHPLAARGLRPYAAWSHPPGSASCRA